MSQGGQHPAVPEAPPADIALYNLKLVEALRLEDRDQLKRLLDAQAAREAEAASGASSTRSSINDHRSSALHLAVQMVSRELVEFLLEFQHLDVNQRDSDGNTPLHLAAQAGRTDVVRELLEKREVNVAIRNDEGLMAVDVARGAEIVNLIVAYRNEYVTQVAPLLHQYATRGDLEAVAQLLASPKAPMFDINHQNPVTGRTTLHEAVASGNVELVEYLLKKGIDPFVRDFKGKTAIELTRSDKIKSLLKDAFNDSLRMTLPGEVPRMQGVLYKWTNFATGYKARYFILENGILSYYKNQADAQNACRGSINIGTAKIWMDSNDKNRFDIVGKGSVRYHLRSEHSVEAKRWILALTQTKQRLEERHMQQSATLAHGNSGGTINAGMFSTSRTVQLGSSPVVRTQINASLHGNSVSVDHIPRDDDDRLRNQAAMRTTLASSETNYHRFLPEDTSGVISPKPAGTLESSSVGTPDTEDLNSLSGTSGPPHGEQWMLTFQTAAVELDVQRQLLSSLRAQLEKPDSGEEAERTQSKELLDGMQNSLEALSRLLTAARNMSEDRDIYWRSRCDAEAERQRLWEESLRKLAAEREEILETLDSVKQLADRSGAKEVVAAIGGGAEELIEEEEDEDEFFDATEENFNFEDVLSGEGTDLAGTKSRRSLSVAAVETEATTRELVTEATKTEEPTILLDEETKYTPISTSFVGYPKDSSGYRKRLPPPSASAPAINVWSVLKNAIGKDLTRFSVPVIFNEPTSMLQRFCEDVEYIDLLDKAVRQRGSAERMLYVAAFAMSNYSSTFGRVVKPFNPLLGETFEYVRPDKGYRYVSEQVTHHPPASACYCDSPNFVFFGEVKVRSKFLGNTLEMHPDGITHLILRIPREFAPESAQNRPKHPVTGPIQQDGYIEEHYTWKKCITAVNNLILGRLTIEHYGEMPITNHLTGDTCTITFKQRGWRGKDEHVVEATVLNAKGEALYELSGKWSDKLVARRAAHAADDAVNLPTHLEMADTSSISASGHHRPAFIIWRVHPRPKEPLPFNLTEFASSLNHCPDTLKPYLPPTDSRLRPDQHALERGEWSLASDEKTRLEEQQRARRRSREAQGLPGESEPRWFVQDIDPDTGTTYWRFNHEYWYERAKAVQAVNEGRKPEWTNVTDIF